MVIQVAVWSDYISKMLYFKHGSLSLLSALFTSITMMFWDFEAMLGGVDKVKIVTPITVEAICVLIFMVFTTIDLITGVHASKVVNSRRKNPLPNVIQSHKLWRTGWKFLSVVMVTFMMMFLSVVLSIANSEWMHTALFWVLVWFWILTIGFEWKSIGENLERSSGNKPKVFKFWDTVLNVVEKQGIARISKLIGGDESVKDVVTPNEEQTKTEDDGVVEDVHTDVTDDTEVTSKEG